MKGLFLRLICLTGAIVLALGVTGFWYLYVTPVTVINLSHAPLRDVEIDLQGKRLSIGTLENNGARKMYGIPGSGSMMAISMISGDRGVHRDVDYMEGGEGQAQVVVIFSPETITAIAIPGRFWK